MLVPALGFIRLWQKVSGPFLETAHAQQQQQQQQQQQPPPPQRQFPNQHRYALVPRCQLGRRVTATFENGLAELRTTSWTSAWSADGEYALAPRCRQTRKGLRCHSRRHSVQRTDDVCRDVFMVSSSRKRSVRSCDFELLLLPCRVVGTDLLRWVDFSYVDVERQSFLLFFF